jgi:hypothetical protein
MMHLITKEEGESQKLVTSHIALVLSVVSFGIILYSRCYWQAHRPVKTIIYPIIYALGLASRIDRL